MNILGIVADVEEDKSTELKEFMIEIDLHQYIESCDVHNYVHRGIYPPEMNLIIEENLKMYCIKYLPKYFASFNNTESIDCGTLYFGIRDNSLVTGIPYKGELSQRMIISQMHHIYNRLRFYQNDKRVKFKYTDFIACFDIEIIPLINKIKKDRSSKKLLKIKNKYNKICDNYNKAYSERQLWKKKFNVYNQKIIVIANDMTIRNELLTFVLTHSDPSQEVINILSLYKSIDIDESEIATRKNNKYDVVYWITKFKDTSRQKNLSQKPRLPMKPSKGRYLNDIERIFRELYPLARKWKDKINYYIIRINIVRPTVDNFDIKYSKLHGTKYQRWVYQERFSGTNGPMCADKIMFS